MNAWLLTWEGTEGAAMQPDRKIVAILSSRHSSASVETLVDALYCRSVNSAYDMATMANKRRQRNDQYRNIHTPPGQIFYGRNPCIFARKVRNLSIKRNESKNEELIEWIELAVCRNSDIGSSVAQVYPEEARSLLRSTKPLASA